MADATAIPTAATALVLGQPDPAHREENRGAEAGPDSFRWPHAITGTDGLLLVADAGDHRLLGWAPHPDGDRPAEVLIGQPDFASADEWPYGPHRGDRFRFPYAAALDQGRLVVADTANNRLLIWDGVPGRVDRDRADGDRVDGGRADGDWGGRPTTCWASRRSRRTGRTAGPASAATPCAGPTASACTATGSPSRTPGTTG